MVMTSRRSWSKVRNVRAMGGMMCLNCLDDNMHFVSIVSRTFYLYLSLLFEIYFDHVLFAHI